MTIQLKYLMLSILFDSLKSGCSITKNKITLPQKILKGADDFLESSSCRAASTDIPDPLSPLLPMIHRLWQVFRATSRILT